MSRFWSGHIFTCITNSEICSKLGGGTLLEGGVIDVLESVRFNNFIFICILFKNVSVIVLISGKLYHHKNRKNGHCTFDDGKFVSSLSVHVGRKAV